VQTKHESVVAMSVYKEDNRYWLQQSVDSILNQSEKNFLFLVVMDGPVCSQTYNYLSKTQQETNKLLLFKTTENRGLSSAMNFLIDYTVENLPDVKFFFRMDADDISEENRISEQVDFLNENEDISIVGSALEEVNEKGDVVGRRHLPQKHELIEKLMPRRCAINHPTVCIRMEVFRKGFRYNGELLNTQDYFLWIDLCADGFKFANLKLSLLKFRRVNDFYKRRGLGKSINEFRARLHAMRQLNKFNLKNILYAILVIIARIMPAKLLKLAYKFDRYLMNRART